MAELIGVMNRIHLGKGGRKRSRKEIPFIEGEKLLAFVIKLSVGRQTKQSMITEIYYTSANTTEAFSLKGSTKECEIF